MTKFSPFGSSQYYFETARESVRNHVEQSTGRPICLRLPQSMNPAATESQNRNIHTYGDWTLSSKQRRLGEAYNYRRNIRTIVDDFTGKPLMDAILHLRSKVRALGVPHINYFTDKPSDIVEIVLALHNFNYLDSTIVVVPSLSRSIPNQLNESMSQIDYTGDPNENVKQNIFRKTKPVITENIDLSKNVISIVNYEQFCKQLMTEGCAFHNRAFVILFDSTYVKHGKSLQEAAKYISDQTVFVDSKYFDNRNNSPDDT